MSKDLATKEQVKGVCQTITNMKTQLESVLPHGMCVDRFISTAKNAIQTHAQQEKLLKADRSSLMLAIQKCCHDGLSIDGREAILNVRGNVVVYEPMTQGLVKLATNSGQISKIEAHVVYETDSFKYRPGLDSEPVFEPDWKLPPSQRGKPILAYGVVFLKDGGKIVKILHEEKIMSIAEGTHNKKQYLTGNPHYAEWWMKAAIRNVLKYAPKSAALERAVKAEDIGQPARAQQEPVDTESNVSNLYDVNPDTGEVINA